MLTRLYQLNNLDYKDWPIMNLPRENYRDSKSEYSPSTCPNKILNCGMAIWLSTVFGHILVDYSSSYKGEWTAFNWNHPGLILILTWIIRLGLLFTKENKVLVGSYGLFFRCLSAFDPTPHVLSIILEQVVPNLYTLISLMHVFYHV